MRTRRARTGHDHAAHNQPAHDQPAHDHAAHGPAAGASGGVGADRRLLAGALALILAFMVAEVLVGLAAGSLALISDAGHMLTDAAAIALALVAMRLATRPPRGGFTYGLRRVEILSAQANGITLVLLAMYFVYEAIRRLLTPPEVTGGPVLVTALVGIVVNVAATWLIGRANRTSLNVEGAFQHILTDLYAFIATALAGLAIVLTGFARADAVAALVVAGLMGKAGIGLIRDAGRIFLEAAPADLDPNRIGADLAAVPSVVEVHDLHVWQITSGMTAASAHVLVAPHGDCHALRARLDRALADTYGITHTTLQVDHAGRSASAGPGMDGDHCPDPHGPVHRSD